jgi:hypothetical protein
MKDRSKSCRGRVKDDWLEFFWQGIAPDYFPALVRRTTRRRSGPGADQRHRTFW